MMLYFQHCSRVRLSDLTLRNAQNWTIRIGVCENVIISGLFIVNNRKIPNKDGIHCTSSRNVLISNCSILTGDDGIIVTESGDDIGTNGFDPNLTAVRHYTFGNKLAIAENEVVSNCIIASASAGLRIGYGLNPIRRCSFSNLIIQIQTEAYSFSARQNHNF